MNKVAVIVTSLLFLCNCAKSQQRVTVYFPFNKAYITSEAEIILDSTLKANSNSIIDSIQIYAWCDSIGTLLINDTLAMQRADAVKNFLIARKIGADKFKEIKGNGKREPINNNSNDSLRALNRRAEVLIYVDKVLDNNIIPIESNGLLPIKNDTITAPKFEDNIRRKIETSKVGDKVRLNNLNFYGGMPILLPSAIPVLDTLVSILNTHASIEIEIQGYVCCMNKGEDAPDLYNGGWKLSVNRAKAIYDYLVGKGINAKRLSHKGFGSQPLVEEITEADRTINRRVEIKIIKR